MKLRLTACWFGALSFLLAAAHSLPDWAKELYESPPLFEITCSCERREFVGTGFLVSDRFVVTAGHVVNAAIAGNLASELEEVEVGVGSKVNVRLVGGRLTESAEVVFYDRDADIAVLKVAKVSGRAPIPVSFEHFNLGEPVIIVGLTVRKIPNPSGAPTITAVPFVLQTRVVNPEFHFLWSALSTVRRKESIAVITDNSVVGGASGSPVLNFRRRAFAVFVAGRDNFGISIYLSNIQQHLSKFLPNPN